MSRTERIAREMYGLDTKTLHDMLRVAEALESGERPSAAAWCKEIAGRYYANPEAALARLRQIEDIRDPAERVRTFVKGESTDDREVARGVALWESYRDQRAALKIEERRAEADVPAPDVKLPEHVKADTDYRQSVRADIERAMGGPSLPSSVQTSLDAWARTVRGEDAYPQETDDLRRTIAAAYDTQNVEAVRAEIEQQGEE